MTRWEMDHDRREAFIIVNNCGDWEMVIQHIEFLVNQALDSQRAALAPASALAVVPSEADSERDRERLDWLQSNYRRIGLAEDHSMWLLYKGFDVPDDFPTLRKAVDAAVAAARGASALKQGERDQK